MFVCIVMSFNRYIVECKYDPFWEKAEGLFVLIDT